MNTFENRKAESQYWFNKSSDLRAAAAALWMSTDGDIASEIVNDCELGTGFSMAVATPPVLHMLCGMAMELVFKALTVETGGTVNESTHDLLLHASSTGLSYTPEERELLKVLSHDIIWAGRYPTPKKESQMADYNSLVRKALFDRVPMGNLTALQHNQALGWESFNSLWSKAAHEFYRIKA